MQATFELSGEILERLRQESARSGRPASALVEAALQTALPAPAGDAADGGASATLPSDAPADNAAPAESDAAQPRPPLNRPSWDMGQPAVDFSNRDGLERALYDDEKSRRRYGFSLYPDTESADAPEAPAANAAPDAAAQPRPPLDLPSWDLGQPSVDVSNRDKPYRMLDDARYWKFAESPDQAGEVPAPETSAAPPPDAAVEPQSRPPLNLPSWSCGKPFVDVNNRDELERALHDDEKFKELYGFYLYPDQEEKE